MQNLVIHSSNILGNSDLISKVQEQFKLNSFVTGELITEEFNLNTPLGIQTKRYQEDGILLDDRLIFQLLDAKMVRYPQDKKNLLFVNFPENENQMNTFQELHIKNNAIFYAIFIHENQEQFYNRAVSQLTSEHENKTFKERLHRMGFRVEKDNQIKISYLQNSEHFLYIEDRLSEEEKFSLISGFFN
ncbi:MAG: hypothetical protein F6K48_04340 [Okeania sp. SIO3H1]|uniref:nucleoside monophosphate kinase n=1 Tax=Okeania sp. SIO1I7 TaxID=2607772 RepID=UPI0013CD609D|nr:nucleoside monophosphate kinase [Okeania sp. SIO1I7]NEN88188.1 hypothetical protein [Okeania sp. SIO3H1]NET24631.1 hypothetical protein [Okeania sp. SIO1I7]